MKVRPLIGAILSLLLVGEVVVGAATGLFQPVGALVFLAMYVSYFYLVDAFVTTYRPTMLRLMYFNAGLYSILITGFFHGELLDLMGQNWLISLLIRLQSSVFVLFVYVILKRLPVPAPKPISYKKAWIWLGVYFLLMSPTMQLGVVPFFHVFQLAPFIAVVALALMVSMFWLAHKPSTQQNRRRAEMPITIAYVLLAASLVPFVGWFVPYTICMLAAAIYLLQFHRSQLV